MPSSPIVHVIDDDDAARESLAFLLQSAQLEVLSYDSATAFLTGKQGLSSGCVITDVRMPDVSGIDLLRRLREGGSHCDHRSWRYSACGRGHEARSRGILRETLR